MAGSPYDAVCVCRHCHLPISKTCSAHSHFNTCRWMIQQIPSPNAMGTVMHIHAWHALGTSVIWLSAAHDSTACLLPLRTHRSPRLFLKRRCVHAMLMAKLGKRLMMLTTDGVYTGSDDIAARVGKIQKAADKQSGAKFNRYMTLCSTGMMPALWPPFPL